MKRILIKNGIVTDDRTSAKADVLIEDGLIKAVGDVIEPSSGDEVIDAAGMYILILVVICLFLCLLLKLI